MKERGRNHEKYSLYFSNANRNFFNEFAYSFITIGINKPHYGLKVTYSEYECYDTVTYISGLNFKSEKAISWYCFLVKYALNLWYNLDNNEKIVTAVIILPSLPFNFLKFDDHVRSPSLSVFKTHISNYSVTPNFAFPPLPLRKSQILRASWHLRFGPNLRHLFTHISPNASYSVTAKFPPLAHRRLAPGNLCLKRI